MMTSLNPPVTVFLVRPSHFGFNEETSESNAFQKNTIIDQEKIRSSALFEFDGMIKKLEKAHIDLIVFESPKNIITPDAVFPNNWISIHHNGLLITYPMMASNRRWERNEEVISTIKNKFKITEQIDLTYFENENKYLEGTGSIVFDHDANLIYAAISPRTNEEVLTQLADILNYKIHCFQAYGPKGEEVYHTNVVMNIGSVYAVVCLDAITDELQKALLKKKLEVSGKKIIEISFSQMLQFAGNMLEVLNKNGESCLLLSQTAFQSLDLKQTRQLKQYSFLIPIEIPVIEQIGGGSVRCMLAGIHASKK